MNKRSFKIIFNIMNVQKDILDINSKMDLVPAECGIAGLAIEESDKSDPQYCKFYQKIGEIFIGRTTSMVDRDEII